MSTCVVFSSRMPDSQAREPVFEFPLRLFRSVHDTPVHSAEERVFIDSVENMWVNNFAQ